jgi:predicted dehydrogenase
MYNVGIVGCGVIGSRLADAFTDHPGTTVWGACDVIESKAESFAAEYDAAAFTDHTELVEQDAVDIVYVGVPPVHHVEVATDALAADKHVICEKPIAEDATAGAELVTAAAESDCVTAVNLPFRYTPGFVEMRERIADGEVGEPRRVDLHFRFPQWPREWQDVSWLESREQGGPIREVGTHFLFGVEEIFGPIQRVAAEVQYSGPETYEESVVGFFAADDAAGGDTGEIHGAIDLACDHEASEENSITVLGSESALSLTAWHRLIRNRGEEDAEVLNESGESTTLALIEEFVTELDGGDGDLVSFVEATRVQRVVDAIFDSGGELVQLGE